MSDSSPTLRAYRHAVRLYPRAFREEYGADLVALYADQLRDEPSWRVAARGSIDLMLTVPNRHMEVHMYTKRSNVVPIVCGAIAFASVIVGVVVGNPLVLAGCLIGGVASGLLGVLAAHRARPITDGAPMSASWWKVLALGAGLMVALIAGTTATGELPPGGWFAAMIAGLASLLMIGAGLVLGIVHLASRPSRHLPAH